MRTPLTTELWTHLQKEIRRHLTWVHPFTSILILYILCLFVISIKTQNGSHLNLTNLLTELPQFLSSGLAQISHILSFVFSHKLLTLFTINLLDFFHWDVPRYVMHSLTTSAPCHSILELNLITWLFVSVNPVLEQESCFTPPYPLSPEILAATKLY